MRRLGILGGTFDPVHFGHLAAAEEARARLALPEVRFIPAWQPPHKLERRVTTAAHRLAMVRLAIADNPAFQLSTEEIDRGGASYTVDTLQHLKRHLGEECDLYFIVGSDALVDFLRWREPHRVLELATLVVVQRPGTPQYDMTALRRQLPNIDQRLTMLEGPRFDLSSTELRERVRTGLPIRYQVPEEVRHYITEHRLYRHAEGD